MTQYFRVHERNPQLRLLRRASELLHEGGIAAYPTDATYALGCLVGNRSGVERIRRLRQLPGNHLFTLICRNLEELSLYARGVSTPVFRCLKSLSPGPYTFILEGSAEVPRRLRHPRRRTIGLRLPACPVLGGLLDQLGQALLSTSAILPGHEFPPGDAEELRELAGSQLDVVIDGGPRGIVPTTVIDFPGDVPRVLREGLGPVDSLS